MAVTLYSLARCPFCLAVKTKLIDQGRSFTEIDVGEHPERTPELMKLTGKRRIVPVLVDGTRIAVAEDGGTEF